MPNNPQPEAISALVAEAKNDPAAFGRLYDHYVQPIYRYLYSRLGSVPEAEDLTSQTFIAAYESLPRYRERGHFAAWLFRIARSKLSDYYRVTKNEIDFDAVQRADAQIDAISYLIQDEEISRLRKLFHNLPAKEQDLIHLRYVAELSFPEMAELLGKREDAMRKSVQRLLARLRSQME
jgi:RNA polymerase sigma-70 factor (ECF subfamily)